MRKGKRRQKRAIYPTQSKFTNELILIGRNTGLTAARSGVPALHLGVPTSAHILRPESLPSLPGTKVIMWVLWNRWRTVLFIRWRAIPTMLAGIAKRKLEASFL